MDDNGARVVIADDTDVFVLLVHFKHASSLGDGPIYMESPLQQRGVIDIDATVEKNRSIIPGLLAAHALSGCDTVASYYGIGKGKVLKVLRGGTTHFAVNFCLYYLQNSIYQRNHQRINFIFFQVQSHLGCWAIQTCQ